MTKNRIYSAILACIIGIIQLCVYGAEQKNMCKIICHRGLSAYEPENTIPAFKACDKPGIYGVECDIRETSDNEFVIMHDADVDRMTDGKGSIKDMSLKEIKALNIDKGNNIEKYKELKVPALNEYLSVCNKINKIPVIEIKDIKKTHITKFLKIIEEYEFTNTAIIISSNKDILLNIKKKAPNIHIQWLCNMSAENIDFCSKSGFDIDVEGAVFKEELLKYAHGKNVKVNIWTVDNLEQLKMFRERGVDFITTNKFR